MTIENKKRVMQSFIDKNFMVSPDILSVLDDNFDFNNFFHNVEEHIPVQEKPKVLDKTLFMSYIIPADEDNFRVKIIESYDKPPIKREVGHFVSFFRARYNQLSSILQNRLELQSPISINKIKNKKPREKVAIIGLVSDIRITKNGNLYITIEDPTGSIPVLINKNKPDLFKQGKDIVMDEVVGFEGTTAERLIFVNDVFFPEVPLSKELKKAPDDVCAVFIADMHVGSDMFMEKEFLDFVKWINGEYGTEEEKEIAKKVKYVFVAGDVVEGAGIYPGQEEELVITEIEKQYDKVAEYLAMIRKDVKIIVSTGNHDASRIAEPQPPLSEKFASAIYKLSNVYNVSNPATVNIHSSKTFPGFDILLYHGYSFDYYISNVESIRNQGGYNRSDLIMQLLLKKRHLCPTHTSSLYIPDAEKDPLVITKIPDFFITGHLHYVSISNYKNVTMICCSCWQGKTSFQEKLGHDPQPCKVPVVNLKTRKVVLLEFDKDGGSKSEN